MASGGVKKTRRWGRDAGAAFQGAKEDGNMSCRTAQTPRLAQLYIMLATEARGLTPRLAPSFPRWRWSRP
jgi:hypothetical protein